MRFPRGIFILVGAAALGTLAASAAEGGSDDEVEAIFSSVSNGYTRVRQADGSFRPESYIFSKGEFWFGKMADPARDNLPFVEIAKTMAVALTQQDYLPATDPKEADLLIVVNWGTTDAPEHQEMSIDRAELEDAEGTFLNSPARLDRVESAGSFVEAMDFMWQNILERNAMMLGYATSRDPDLRRYRYFVVLLAYDYPAFARRHETKLLWQVRFSISEHRNQFDKRLAAIAGAASEYFGRESGGLTRRMVPFGQVRIGEIRTVDGGADAAPAAIAPDGNHVAYLWREGAEHGFSIVDLDAPDRLVTGKDPILASASRIAWTDADHLAIGLSPSQSLRFDSGGKLLGGGGPLDAAGAALAADARAAIQAEVDAKFPHRRVSILGADQPARRILLAVTGGDGSDRYYVFDRTEDVLTDVGRPERKP